MRQLIYIIMFLSSACFAQDVTKNTITKEQLKIIEEKRQTALKVVQKVAIQTQPMVIYMFTMCKITTMY